MFMGENYGFHNHKTCFIIYKYYVNLTFIYLFILKFKYIWEVDSTKNSWIITSCLMITYGNWFCLPRPIKSKKLDKPNDMTIKTIDSD